MGMKLIFLFRIMIVRTATRFEFPTGPGRSCACAFFWTRRTAFCVCDSEDKDVWIYICYVSGGPGYI